jgi:hypothetical protein
MLVRLREMEHQRPCPRHEEQVNPHPGLADPSGGRVLERWPFLVGKRRLLGFQGISDAILQGRVYRQTHGHAHPEGHDPLRFFQVERRGEKEWIFEKPKAAFGMLLAFIPCQEVLRGEGTCVEFVGGKHKTTLWRHEGVTERQR